MQTHPKPDPDAESIVLQTVGNKSHMLAGLWLTCQYLRRLASTKPHLKTVTKVDVQ